MSDGFAEAYTSLREFIQSHPEIEIGESVTSIPENVRTDFYCRFNAAREAFIEDRCPLFLSRAQRLQESFAKAEKDVAALVSWEETQLASPVQRFLASSRDTMARELFDPLFDLLKGKQTIGSFGQTASERIAAFWPAVFRGGYEKWAILSLVSLLEPEEALRVDCGLLGPGERAKSAAYAPLANCPDPVASRSFFFNPPQNAVLAVPDLIIRSGVLNCYVGIRSEFREGLYNAMNISSKREWTPVDTDLLIALDNGLTLLYAADRAEDIALVADATRFCRPDLVLWCVDSSSMNPEEALKTIEFCEARLNPVKGSFIISDEPWPELAGRFLNSGLERSQLMPLIDALKSEPQIPQISQNENPSV
jgi:hypothetical protein